MALMFGSAITSSVAGGQLYNTVPSGIYSAVLGVSNKTNPDTGDPTAALIAGGGVRQADGSITFPGGDYGIADTSLYALGSPLGSVQGIGDWLKENSPIIVALVAVTSLLISIRKR